MIFYFTHIHAGYGRIHHKTLSYAQGNNVRINYGLRTCWKLLCVLCSPLVTLTPLVVLTEHRATAEGPADQCRRVDASSPRWHAHRGQLTKIKRSEFTEKPTVNDLAKQWSYPNQHFIGRINVQLSISVMIIIKFKNGSLISKEIYSCVRACVRSCMCII